MDCVERSLLAALRAAVHGETVRELPLSAEQWKELMKLAGAQKVQPLVLHAAYACAVAQGWAESISLQRACTAQYAAQARKTAKLLELYRFLAAQGLRPLVVKGVVCRAVYPEGELRPSADEDFYVPHEEFTEARAALRAFGMMPLPAADEAEAFELGWYLPGSALYVELHQRLFPDEPERLRQLQAPFADAFSRAVEYPLPGGEAVWSLCPHDELLYLLLHALKHFLHGGFGVRQVCDIGLWAQRYAERIDWPRLLEQCRAQRAERFAAAIFAIAEEQLGLTVPLSPDWHASRVDSAPLLKDLLHAGIYGTATGSRRHAAPLILRAAEAKSGTLHALFPPLRALRRRDPVLDRRPWLLPWAWGKRIVKYRKEVRKSTDNTTRETLRIVGERKKLLQVYGVL